MPTSSYLSNQMPRSFRVEFLALKVSHKIVAFQKVPTLLILQGHGSVSIATFEGKSIVSDWSVCIF